MCAHTKVVRNTASQKHPKKRPSFTLSLLSLALLGLSGVASAQYVDPGYVGNATSWETDEYKGNWGVGSMKASKAYALGFYGQGVKVGVMDSGAMDTHQEFDPTRFIYVDQEGVYGTSGMRYRGAGWYYTRPPSGIYTAGDPFSLTGAQDPAFNDSHGTAVAGIVGSSRDGVGTHGISWGSEIVVGNTGGTDNNNYGPYQDYNFFYTGWKAMVDAGAQVINNSWGTNIRVNLSQDEDPDPYDTVHDYRGNSGYVVDQLTGTRSTPNVYGLDGGNISNMIPTNTLADVEYEYFYWKLFYGEGNKSFTDAAWDAIKNTPNKVVMIMTTGNRDMANPFHRALYPYFHPEAESQWIAAAGIQRISGDPNGHLRLVTSFNEAGLAKWWTVVGASGGVVTPSISADNSRTPEIEPSRDPAYYTTGFSGTSSSAPHIAGAMGVLLSRYPNMNSSQVRDVMFTTATNRNTDGTIFDLWTAAEGVPDERYGWGLPDLEKGMYGPGQFLGKLEYNASVTPLDVWTNDISQVALDARETEELQWLQNYRTGGIDALGEYHLGDTYYGYDQQGNPIEVPMIVADNDDPASVADATTNHIVDLADAKRWREEYADARAAEIQRKIDEGLYDGSLVKLGAGTLVMTGNNSYRGGTTVKEGSLFGFTESFGTDVVKVNGGVFGILSTYTDNFTHKGLLNSNPTHKASVEVNDGGTYALVVGNAAEVDSLTFASGSQITVAPIDEEQAKDIYTNGGTFTGTLDADTINGFDNAALVNDYALLHAEVTKNGNSLTGTLSANGSVLADYADNEQERSIADAVNAAGGGALFDTLLTASKEEVAETLKSLSNNFFQETTTTSVVNALGLAQTVRTQAVGFARSSLAMQGDGKAMMFASAAMQPGDLAGLSQRTTARMWASVTASWADNDFRQSYDSDTQTVLVGAEVNVTTNNALGLVLGAGRSKYKGDNYGDVDSDDLHIGIYGSYRGNPVGFAYGIIHTNQNRDADRWLNVAGQAVRNSVNANTTVTQAFGEVALTMLNNDRFTLEPYFGASVIKVKADGYKEVVNNMTFVTDDSDQTLESVSLGVRGAFPFDAGSVRMAVKGDLTASHFFGDTEPETDFDLAGSGVVVIKGEEIKNLFDLSLGIEAAFSENTRLELSYIGSYNSDIKSHGVYLNFRMGF